MSKAGKRILKNVRRARGFASGEDTNGLVVHVPEEVDVRAIRGAIKLTREGLGAGPQPARAFGAHLAQGD